MRSALHIVQHTLGVPENLSEIALQRPLVFNRLHGHTFIPSISWFQVRFILTSNRSERNVSA